MPRRTSVRRQTLSANDIDDKTARCDIVESVIAVLLDSSGRALLTKRGASMRSFPGTWCFPGGAVDSTESPSNAAIRETREEVGLSCRAPHALGELLSFEPNRGREYRIHCFLIEEWSGDLSIDFASGEVAAHVWIRPLEALETLDLAGPATEAILQHLTQSGVARSERMAGACWI